MAHEGDRELEGFEGWADWEERPGTATYLHCRMRGPRMSELVSITHFCIPVFLRHVECLDEPEHQGSKKRPNHNQSSSSLYSVAQIRQSKQIATPFYRLLGLHEQTLRLRIYRSTFSWRFVSLVPVSWPSKLLTFDPSQIAPHLYPLDVIHLSRTSKPLRSLLMSKNSRPIWTTALSNVVDLPPCPTDMSEPLYAALVFDHHCFVGA